MGLWLTTEMECEAGLWVPRDKHQEPWLYWLGEKCIWKTRGITEEPWIWVEKWEWVQMLNCRSRPWKVEQEKRQGLRRVTMWQLDEGMDEHWMMLRASHLGLCVWTLKVLNFCHLRLGVVLKGRALTSGGDSFKECSVSAISPSLPPPYHAPNHAPTCLVFGSQVLLHDWKMLQSSNWKDGRKSGSSSIINLLRPM